MIQPHACPELRTFYTATNEFHLSRGLLRQRFKFILRLEPSENRMLQVIRKNSDE